MRVLVIAPQPFYQERGTPIATRMLVDSLRREDHLVDILTYSEGLDPGLENVRVFRIPDIPFLQGVPIGFSWRKIFCDVLLTWKLWSITKKNEYDVLHAVEESIFSALLIRPFRGNLVVYDMDSSLVEQILEKYRAIRPLKRLLCAFERMAVARSDLVVAVCNDLALRAHGYHTMTPIRIVEDVSLVSTSSDKHCAEDLRCELGIKGLLAMYVGNLEDYQGVRLLLGSLAALDPSVPLRLVVIGGSPDAIREHRSLAESHGLSDRVDFVGPRPVADLTGYLSQADILVSPRLNGHNTPMKLYSYLGAGRAILATDIRSHTQVLNSDCAVLVETTASAMASGLETLARNAQLRERLGVAAAELASSRYSLERFHRSVADVYKQLESDPRSSHSMKQKQADA